MATKTMFVSRDKAAIGSDEVTLSTKQLKMSADGEFGGKGYVEFVEPHIIKNLLGFLPRKGQQLRVTIKAVNKVVPVLN